MADEGQDKGYEVKDKRRVNADGTLKKDEEAQEPATEAADEGCGCGCGHDHEHDHEHAHEADMPIPSVNDLLQFMVGMLAEQAWMRMGIRLAPGQKEAEPDMVQAKLAIDTIVFMSDKLHPHVGEEERKALRALVSDLQLNFVRHQGS